jgi:hypothetical protein
VQHFERPPISESARQRGEAEARKYIEENRAREKFVVRWIARIGFIPLFLLATADVAVVIYWLFGGKVKEISRYGSRMIFSGEQPVEFWISIAYHSAIAIFLCFATVVCFRATGWTARKNKRLI